MTQEKKKFSRKDMKSPDEFIKKSWEVSEWAGDHARQIIIVSATIVITILVVALLWSTLQGRKIKSSKQLETVFKVSDKGIAPTEYIPGQEASKDEDTFGSKFHKDEALLDAYRTTRDNAKTAGVRRMATLGMASALLSLDRFGQARKEYESLLPDLEAMTGMQHFVYEGLAFACLGQGKRDEALKQLEKLERCEGGAYKELARYHQARIYELENKKDEAAKRYQEIGKAINESTELTPLLAYLQKKIAGKAGVDTPFMFKGLGGGMGGASGTEITPQMLEMLQKQLKEIENQKQAGGSSGAGAGAKSPEAGQGGKAQ